MEAALMAETEEVENPMVDDGDERPLSVQLDLWIEESFGFVPVHPSRWTQSIRVNPEYL